MLARILDIALIGLAGLTMLLIVWKSVELFFPGLLGRASIETKTRSAEELDLALEKAEQMLPLLATIAGVAPFIGLAATVLHIMSGLQMLSGTNLEASVLAGPIATALNSTLLGLAAAVPAFAAYNLMARKLQVVENRVRRALNRKSAEAQST